MKHHVSETDALRKTGTRGGDRPRQVKPGCFLRNRFKFSGSHHFGDDHCRCLKRLDLVLKIGPVRLVLDDKNAERSAGAQNGHPKEGVIGFFACFRQVGKPRVGAGVRQIERPRLGSNQTDKALADAKRCIVNRLPVQAFGRIELKHAIRTQDINRTHLGNDVRRNQDDDLVQSLLRRDRFRHDFAEPAEQKARSG